MPDIFGQILASTAPRVCVIAAPGSGKTTRVLIPNAAKVLIDDTVDPKEVLLLTFSRLSAMDLKAKVKTMDRAPRASTVHSLCLAFLISEDNHDIRKRIDSILLDFERDFVIADLKLVFPSVTRPQLQKELEKFSAGWATQPHGKVFEDTPYHRDFKAAVVNWLSEHEAAMMEEIVYSAVDLAQKLGSPSFIQEPQYIFVDEVQDLNVLEQEFINLLAADSKRLLVVGDPDQSIYSFKYAHPEGIKRFGETTELYLSRVTMRCPKVVVAFANQLLKQADPDRTDLLESGKTEDGEVHFVRKQRQEDEFRYVLCSIADRLNAAAAPAEIVVLAPRRILAAEFASYANKNKAGLGVANETRFVCALKRESSDLEQERILLFSLLVKPNSLLHIRSYLGLRDDHCWAREIKKLKEKYSGLSQIVSSARAEDFPTGNTRVRQVCESATRLRAFLEEHTAESPVDADLLPDQLRRPRGLFRPVLGHDGWLQQTGPISRQHVDYELLASQYAGQ